MYMQKKWLDKYADHALPFTVGMPGNKWSHTIYSSWFTGFSLFLSNIYLLFSYIFSV